MHALGMTRRVAAVLAAATLLLVSGCDGPAPENGGPAETGSDDVAAVISRLSDSMKAEHSYRVDGLIEIYDGGGYLDRAISVSGDYVRPDRLKLDLEGHEDLEKGVTHQTVIIGDRAYHRERHAPGIRGRTEWEELSLGMVDPSYLGDIPDLTLSFEDYLSSVTWTSVEALDDGARLRGWTGVEGSRVVVYHHLVVHDYEFPPRDALRHWVDTLEIVTVAHGGSGGTVLRMARYRFSLYLSPLEVREPRIK